MARDRHNHDFGPPRTLRASACRGAVSKAPEIRRALETVARLVLTDPKYLGLFRRLERELEAARQIDDDLARAMQYLSKA